MVRHRRPVRGGKQRFVKHADRNAKPKVKRRGTFDIKTASYVKEREIKNEEIENRRRRIEEEKLKRKRYEEAESSDDEEDEVESNPLESLLSTFKGQHSLKVAIESDSEDEDNEECEDINEECEDIDEECEDIDEECEDIDEECEALDEDMSEEEDEDDEVNEDEEMKLSEDEEDEDCHEDEEENRKRNKKVKSVDEDNEDLHEDLHEDEEQRRKKSKKVKKKDEEEVEIEVEENEEDAETAREDAGELQDPFSIHLRNDLSEELFNCISKGTVDYNVTKLNWPALGDVTYMLPNIEATEKKSKEIKKPKLNILEDKEYTKAGTIAKRIQKVKWEKLHVKSQIVGNLSRANFKNIKDCIVSEKSPSPMTSLQKELFSIINNYQDLLFMERTFANADEIRFVYCLHAINHVLKTRTKILHHNAKLQKMKKNATLVPDEYRDQGLVRPKVLILVPLKHSCLQLVTLLISILIGEDKGGSVINKKRFLEEYSGNELSLPKRKPKPEDYEETFKGNVDDTFKIGISITKKTLKLYTNFYSSDIIIASPLGLRMLIGAEGETDTDYDFLASIELLILDQTELFLMQNWDHLLHIFQHLHLQPKSTHDTDFSRVRSWCATGHTKFYRQSLIFSALQTPEIHSIFNKHCRNYAGRVKIVNPISPGSVSQTIVQVPLHFHRMQAKNPTQLMDARLQFFATNILPHYRDSIMNHTLIYVPSYYDYVALRNFMNDEELSFVQICEYTKDAKVARARDMFFHSDAHFMLYSERAHFFHRRQIKGIRHLIFYAPPVMPHFFSEMCNLMQESNQNPKAGSDSNMTVILIYSQYDVLQLSAIVGTERACRMAKSDKDVHMIMIKD